MTKRFLITILTVFSILPMLAQGPRGFGGPNGPPNRLEFLAGYLGLSDSQKTQAQAIFDAADKTSETAMGQLTSARDSLQTAVKENAAESELDRLAAAVGVIEGQLAGIRAKASAKFYALLTTDQKQKYDSLGNRAGGPPHP